MGAHTMDHRHLLRPYMRQFYRGNGWRFSLALSVTLVQTASAMMASWLIQVIIDLATGADIGFSFTQVVLLTVASIFIEAFAFFLAYHSKPKFIARGVGQYK